MISASDVKTTFLALLEHEAFSRQVVYGATTFRAFYRHTGARDGVAVDPHLWTAATTPAWNVEQGDTVHVGGVAYIVDGTQWDGLYTIRMVLRPQIEAS